jgi:hypothetical protein
MVFQPDAGESKPFDAKPKARYDLNRLAEELG